MGWVTKQTRAKAEAAARALTYATRRARRAGEKGQEWLREAEQRWQKANRALLEEAKG